MDKNRKRSLMYDGMLVDLNTVDRVKFDHEGQTITFHTVHGNTVQMVMDHGCDFEDVMFFVMDEMDTEDFPKWREKYPDLVKEEEEERMAQQTDY